MKIYTVRHGQTEWNKKGFYQGKTDIPLSEEGKKQAILVKEKLKDKKIDLIISSPLKRAKETAALFLGERKVPVIEDARIQEISFGVYEGLTCGKDNYSIPDPEFHSFFEHPERYQTPPGGESLEELGARTKAFMEDIMHRPELQDKTVLVSSHGCATRGILNSIRSFDMADFWHGGVPKNCSVALIRVENGKPSLIYENRTF